MLTKLAVGGMAEIYLARASSVEGFEKYVVVKRILPHLAQDERFIRMFLDEARLAALLQHQNIAQVHDIGESDGHYFFTMEYLHGVDCRRLLSDLHQRNQRLPLSHALTIITNAAAGLHYAHGKRGSNGLPLGIVHRDVSLSNVVVTYDGGIKLVDFGVARATERDSRTKTGGLKGKVGYMSPEQCRGRSVDRRSDIFSLGVVLFELSTGYRPFGSADDLNDYSTMFQIVEDPPRIPSELVPNFPLDLQTIVMRMLEKNPDDRYQDARSVLIDLESFAANNRLPLSASALAAFMEDIYGNPEEPWHNLPDDLDETSPFDEPIKKTISFANPPEGSISTSDMPTVLKAYDRPASGHDDPTARHPSAPPAADVSPFDHGQQVFTPMPPIGTPAPSTDRTAGPAQQTKSDPYYGVHPSARLSSPVQTTGYIARPPTGEVTPPHHSRATRPLLTALLIIVGVAGGLVIAWQLTRVGAAEPTEASEREAEVETGAEAEAAEAETEPTRPAIDPAGQADTTATGAMAPTPEPSEDEAAGDQPAGDEADKPDEPRAGDEPADEPDEHRAGDEPAVNSEQTKPRTPERKRRPRRPRRTKPKKPEKPSVSDRIDREW